MEAFPPGSDQLPSWGKPQSSEYAHASRGYTAWRNEESGGGRGRSFWGGAAFNIILGSNLIRFVFSYLVHVSIYCYLSARAAAFYSCVIMPQGGDQKYAWQCNAPLCMLLWSCEYSSWRRRATIQNFRFKITRVQTHLLCVLCWIKTFFSHHVLVAKILQQPSGELSDLIS